MTTLSLNVGNFNTLKLTPTNYPLWREQVEALVESQELIGHLTNEDPTPIKYTSKIQSTLQMLKQTPNLQKLSQLGESLTTFFVDGS